jgi:hypothetical protein
MLKSFKTCSLQLYANFGYYGIGRVFFELKEPEVMEPLLSPAVF